MEDSMEKWLKTKQQSIDSMSVCKPGDIVGNWKILALLGRGGSAEVYRVEHVESKKIGALKLLCRREETSRNRFVRECELLREQNIASFAKFFDSGEKDGRLFLVTEELQALELPHKDPEVTEFVVEVCKAVQVLHSEGYVHRDLKPGNIMRRADGSYVLIDLGLVKKVTAGDSPGFTDKSLSIVDGKRECVGTPEYSAPEQFVSGKATEASDIHAIGVLIKKCFKASPPSNWSRLIERATSSIDSLRYQSVDDLLCAIRVSSAIRPTVALIAEVLSAIELVFWGLCFSLLAIGMSFGKISYESGQRNVVVLLIFGGIVGWLSLVEFGIRRRKNLARLYIVFMGIVSLLTMLGVGFSVEVGRSFWLMAILLVASRIIPGILFLLPKVRRWFKASDL
ncbi:MAG: serine/threonine protein kinase [Kiritimatiellae bacterium]|nr:serine/threonine protein kinase [Kiritimatiellia bacterium]